MFACSSVKVNPFDYYNHVETQFISIKNLNSFQNYTIISSNDLIWFVFPIASPFVNCIDLATLFI